MDAQRQERGQAPEYPKWAVAAVGLFLAAFVVLAYWVFLSGGRLIEVLDAFY